MAIQQTVIPCLGGAWTPICPYRPGRKSLMIQCPQSGTTINPTNPSIVDNGVAVTVLTANPLRKGFWISSGPFVPGMGTTSSGVTPAAAGGAAGNLTNGAVYSPNDDQVGQVIQHAWEVEIRGAAAVSYSVVIFEEVYQCTSIILGIQQNTNLYTGPNGIVPVGFWQSPSLSAGPTIFRLNEAEDDEAVIQEWFAWPVGNTLVNVPVIEVFTSPALDDPDFVDQSATLTVNLPKLTRRGVAALNELLAKVSPQEPQ